MCEFCDVFRSFCISFTLACMGCARVAFGFVSIVQLTFNRTQTWHDNLLCAPCWEGFCSRNLYLQSASGFSPGDHGPCWRSVLCIARHFMLFSYMLACSPDDRHPSLSSAGWLWHLAQFVMMLYGDVSRVSFSSGLQQGIL